MRWAAAMSRAPSPIDKLFSMNFARDRQRSVAGQRSGKADRGGHRVVAYLIHEAHRLSARRVVSIAGVEHTLGVDKSGNGQQPLNTFHAIHNREFGRRDTEFG